MVLLITILCLITFTDAKSKKRRLGVSEKEAHDIYPSSYKELGNFGHVYKDRADDPYAELKKPLDLLEMDMIVPKTPEEQKVLLSRTPKKNLQRIVKTEKPKGFINPRDKYLYYRDNLSSQNVNIEQVPKKNVSRPMWFDFPYMQEANLNTSPIRSRLKNDKKKVINSGPYRVDGDQKKQFFSRGAFDLMTDNSEYAINWTTCKEFATGAKFYPRDVVDIDWIPFFIWSTRPYVTSIVHKFSFPTKRLVKFYKEEFGPYLMKKVDWQQPMLVMKEVGEMLLIAGDRKGLFDAIPYHQIPPSIKSKGIHVPMMSIRLKIEDPYLVMMFCEDRYASVMAVSGNEPDTLEERRQEASTINFRGRGCPVKTDLESEREEAKRKRERQLEKESRKYITIPDDRSIIEPILK